MTTTIEASRIIEAASAANSASLRSALDECRSIANSWKPSGFDADRKLRLSLYRGTAKTFFEERLRAAFPNSLPIPPLVYNYARLYAETNATFYHEEPERVLSSAAGEVSEEQQAAWDALLDRCGARVKLPELERRAAWCLESLLAVRVREVVQADGSRRAELRLELHPVQNAWIQPDPDAPSDLQRAHAFALLTRWGARGAPAIEFWTRDDESGAWSRSIERMDGGAAYEAAAAQPGKLLPFVLLRVDEPDSSPYVDRGDDDVEIVISQIVDESDAAQTERLQAHADRVYRGTRDSDLKGGPDKVLRIDVGEDLFTLSYDPKIIERRDSLRRRQELWERTTRSPQGSFSPSAEVPESGIARQIRNAPAEKKAREHAAIMVEFEERRLWPVVLEQHEHYVEGASLAGLEVSVTPRHAQAYEDPEAKQRRWLELHDAGVVTKARLAVELGIYKTVAEAVEAGLSDELRGTQQTPEQPGGRLAALLAARRGTPPAPEPETPGVEDEDDEGGEEDEEDG